MAGISIDVKTYVSFIVSFRLRAELILSWQARNRLMVSSKQTNTSFQKIQLQLVTRHLIEKSNDSAIIFKFFLFNFFFRFMDSGYITLSRI